MNDKLIYLASPYSKYPGGREEAFNLACKKAAEVMSMGYAVFCPIAHSHPIELIGEIPSDAADHNFWLAQDFAILDKCDELWIYMMPGWEESFGVNAEIDRANRLGLTIEYLYFDDKDRAYFKTS